MKDEMKNVDRLVPRASFSIQHSSFSIAFQLSRGWSILAVVLKILSF